MKTAWLLLTLLFAATCWADSLDDLENPIEALSHGIDLEEDYDDEPLGDIEEELEELIEENDEDDEEDEEVIYYEEDIDDEEYDDDDESASSEEGRRGRRRNRKNFRQRVRTISRYMRNHEVTEVDEVPGRKFGPGLRRVHNSKRQEQPQGEEEQPGRGNGGRVYRKIIRVVEKRIRPREPGQKFDGFCQRLSTKSGPRQRAVQALPEDLQEQYLAMFDTRREQLDECCQMDGEEREECFQDAYEMKMDNLCMIQFQMDELPARTNSMFLRMMSSRQECCQILEPTERSDCFKEKGRRVRRHRRAAVTEEEDFASMSPQSRVDRICRRIAEHGDSMRERSVGRRGMREETRERMQRRWEGMMQCCETEGEARVTCARTLMRNKLMDICSDTEIRGPNSEKRQEIKDRCCALEEAAKEQCFAAAARAHLEDATQRRKDRRTERRQGRGGARRQQRDVSEEEGEEDWTSLTPQRRVDKICRKVEQQSVGGRREGREMTEEKREMLERKLEEMMQCCEMEGEDRLRCALALRRRKFEEICDTELSGPNSEKKQEVKDRCCGLEDEQMEECFAQAIRETIEEKLQRRRETRTERREGRREERQGVREERKEGRRNERRENRREGRRHERQERRRVRVEIEEEVEIEQEEDREKRAIVQVTRYGTRRQRQHHRRQDVDSAGNNDRRVNRRRNRGSGRECCTAGRDFGLTLELPNDGFTVRVQREECETASYINAPVINDGDKDDDKCTAVYKSCCIRSKYPDVEDDSQEWGRRRKHGGRRRRVRVEVEEEVDDDADYVIDGMIASADHMIAAA